MSLTTVHLVHAALKRKGKGEDVTEDDMQAVVHAHNCMPLAGTSQLLIRVMSLDYGCKIGLT